MRMAHPDYSLSQLGVLEAEWVTVHDPGVPGNAWRAYPGLAYARIMAEAAGDPHMLRTGWLESTALTAGRHGVTVARRSNIDARNVLEPGCWRRAWMGGSISRTVFPGLG
jgi:UDPglucose 6-dehydrogenase